jgi:hypothetical protein
LLVLVIAVAFAKVALLDQRSIIDHVNSLSGVSWKAGHNHYFDGKSMD